MSQMTLRSSARSHEGLYGAKAPTRTKVRELDPPQDGEGEEMDAAPASRPSFAPPPEGDLRGLAASLVASFREEENFSLFEAYARISLPGSHNPAEDLVLNEIRRHLGVVKSMRPRVEDVMPLLKLHIGGCVDEGIKGYREVIFDLLTSATNEPAKTYRISARRTGYPILIASRKCVLIVERQDGGVWLIDLQTEKDFNSKKTRNRENDGIFRRQFASR